MRIIKPYYQILTPIFKDDVYKTIEQIARTCYRSENLITEGSAEKIISSLISNKHEAMLEFFDITIKFVCSRSVSHELVRHRTASYAQESQRFVNYSKAKFNKEITFIEPWFFKGDNFTDNPNDKIIRNMQYNIWKEACQDAEKAYFKLLQEGATSQEARTVLPNSTKTEINIKNDLRNWRHFLTLRTPSHVDPQMRELTIPLLRELKAELPLIFNDIREE